MGPPSSRNGKYRPPLDTAPVPQLRTRLNERAHQRAMHELRDRHRDEYDHLLERHRGEMGVFPDRIDLEVALAAFHDRHSRQRRRPS